MLVGKQKSDPMAGEVHHLPALPQFPSKHFFFFQSQSPAVPLLSAAATPSSVLPGGLGLLTQSL